VVSSLHTFQLRFCKHFLSYWILNSQLDPYTKLIFANTINLH
jgi:hypothetical protein